MKTLEVFDSEISEISDPSEKVRYAKYVIRRLNEQLNNLIALQRSVIGQRNGSGGEATRESLHDKD